MKKLMIAAAIVCAAVVSQAMTFNWISYGRVTAINSQALADGLKANTTYTTSGYTSDNIDNLGWTLAYTMILDDVSNGARETLTGTVVTDGSGFINMTGLIAAGIEEFDNVNYTVNYTANITDGKSKNWTVTGSGNGYIELIGTEVNIEGPTTWTTGADSVPEPTSALLMLLGMAGVALKRKRA